MPANVDNIIKSVPDIDLRTLIRRNTIQPIINDHNFYPYASGRAAIYAAARMLSEIQPKIVHMPSFHCGVEVEGFVRAGFEVRFYPVDRLLNIDLNALEKGSFNPGDIFFVIHYFGFPQPVEILVNFCRERGMVMIEDCAHALYSKYKGRYLGTFGHMSVFSMRKTIALPNGGGLLINTNKLPPPPPSAKRLIPSLFKATIRSILDNEIHQGSLLAIPARIILRSYQEVIDNNERPKNAHGAEQPPAFYEDRRFDYDLALSRMSKWLLQTMQADQIAMRRRRNYMLLAKALVDKSGPEPIFPKLGEMTVPLYLPVWVDSSDRWMKELFLRGVEGFVFGRRPHSMLPPSLNKQSQHLREQIIGLPVQQDLELSDIHHIAQCVGNIFHG